MTKSENKNNPQQNKLIVFQNKNIRRVWHEEEWFYSVVDIVEVLTDSPTPRQYWGKVKDREFTKFQLSPIWVQLKLMANDGKNRLTDCVNTKGAFRLIQSIPSKKAEPFKQWLAQVGKERVTTEISKEEKPETFGDNKKVAQRGGKVAGDARLNTEKELGRTIVSDKNNLDTETQLKLEK